MSDGTNGTVKGRHFPCELLKKQGLAPARTPDHGNAGLVVVTQTGSQVSVDYYPALHSAPEAAAALETHMASPAKERKPS
jgi:hypothetical protein